MDKKNSLETPQGTEYEYANGTGPILGDFAEVIKDVGLINAIKEGRAGYTVSKKDVLKI